MRLFFALLPDARLARRIADWRDSQLSAEGRPVPVANLHITLAFLGEISPYRVEGLCHEVELLLDRSTPSTGVLTLDRVGYWPRPGIFWLGPRAWQTELEKLSAGLQGCGKAAGARGKQQRFQPHITLFRQCRQPPPAPVAPSCFDFPYRDISLLQSRDGRRGVRYDELASWSLEPS